MSPHIDTYAKATGDYYARYSTPPEWDRARTGYRLAVEANPWSAYNWLNYAETQMKLEKPERAAKAYKVASEIDPHNRFVQLETGNFFFTREEVWQAIPYYARAIKLEPGYAQSIYAVYWSLGFDPVKVARELVWHSPKLMRTYFNKCLEWLEPEQIEPIWQAFQEVDDALDMDSYRNFYNYLMAKEEYDRVRTLWAEIAQKYYEVEWNPDAELFWNGNLERPLAFEGGLEWQIHSRMPEGAQADISGANILQGKWALRISFAGKANIRFSHVRHALLLEPDTDYILRYQVSAVGITTHNGPYVMLTLHGPNGKQLRDEIIKGTERRQMELPFTTPPDCHWGELFIRRDVSKKLNNKIAGMVTYDNFTIEKVQP